MWGAPTSCATRSFQWCDPIHHSLESDTWDTCRQAFSTLSLLLFLIFLTMHLIVTAVCFQLDIHHPYLLFSSFNRIEAWRRENGPSRSCRAFSKLVEVSSQETINSIKHTHTSVQLCGQPWGSEVIYQQEDSLTDWKSRRRESENRS